MWDCPHCGCQAITSSVEFCPQCFVPRDTPAVAVAEGEGTSTKPVESGDQVGDPDSGQGAPSSASPQDQTAKGW